MNIIKNGAGNVHVFFQLINTTLEEMQELYDIGDKYLISDFDRRRL
jgi:hypothetical protein